jgi:hypothetical protein
MTRLLPDQQLVQERLSRLPTSISNQDRTILSLDGFLIGYVKAEMNGKITIVNSSGDQFLLPGCRIISPANRIINGFVVDIEYHKVSEYRTIEHQSGNN